ncbi:MAG: hypothetical protein OXD30_07655 [Bryobacterales bacterium]|nr:hypothetical protein [Bryobacterales bacterium]
MHRIRGDISALGTALQGPQHQGFAGLAIAADGPASKRHRA